MTNVKFNRKPFEGNFSNLVDDLFTGIPVLFKNEFNNQLRKDFIPVNVKESAGHYILEVVAPGFEKTDFNINLDQQVLTISAGNKSGEKPAPETTENKKIRTEYNFNGFKRSFTLDDKINATKIDANYVNGVLLITLPKKEEVKPVATQITVN